MTHTTMKNDEKRQPEASPAEFELIATTRLDSVQGGARAGDWLVARGDWIHAAPGTQFVLDL